MCEQSLNTTESFVHLNPAIHIINFLINLFLKMFYCTRKNVRKGCNQCLLVGVSYHFMMNKAYLLIILDCKLT